MSSTRKSVGQGGKGSVEADTQCFYEPIVLAHNCCFVMPFMRLCNN